MDLGVALDLRVNEVQRKACPGCRLRVMRTLGQRRFRAARTHTVDLDGVRDQRQPCGECVADGILRLNGVCRVLGDVRTDVVIHRIANGSRRGIFIIYLFVDGGFAGLDLHSGRSHLPHIICLVVHRHDVYGGGTVHLHAVFDEDEIAAHGKILNRPAAGAGAGGGKGNGPALNGSRQLVIKFCNLIRRRRGEGFRHAVVRADVSRIVGFDPILHVGSPLIHRHYRLLTLVVEDHVQHLIGADGYAALHVLHGDASRVRYDVVRREGGGAKHAHCQKQRETQGREPCPDLALSVHVLFSFKQ